MNQIPEPTAPFNTRPHRDRVRAVEARLPEDKVGAICVDTENKDWYLQELKKYPRLSIEYQGALTDAIYVIKVRKLPSLN